jgi:hypothetical protein
VQCSARLEAALISATHHLVTLLGWEANTGRIMVALSEQSFWNLPLDHPIEVGHADQRLATLGDVGTFILALPEALQQQQSWQAATETVLEAAKSGDTAPVTLVLHMALMLSGQNARSVWE